MAVITYTNNIYTKQINDLTQKYFSNSLSSKQGFTSKLLNVIEKLPNKDELLITELIEIKLNVS